jgi:hypothetical protein
MPTTLNLFAIILTSLTLAACAPKEPGTESATDGSSSDGSSSDGTTDATTDAPATTGSSTDTPTTDGSTTEEPVTCEDPSVAEVGPEVKISLQNGGDGTIWVDRRLFCGRVLPFDIVDAEGTMLNLTLGLCEFTCEEILAGDCGCQAGCGEFDQVVTIQPGETLELAWSGAHWPTFPVTEACSVGCETSCVARQQAAPGKYKVVARSSGALAECDKCECEESEPDLCVINAIRAGDELVVEAELDYPAQTAVVIVFP